MNTLSKWLNKSVTVTLGSMMGQLCGTLTEVDERWLTLQRNDNVIVVVPVFTAVQICLDGKQPA